MTALKTGGFRAVASYWRWPTLYAWSVITPMRPDLSETFFDGLIWSPDQRADRGWSHRVEAEACALTGGFANEVLA